MSPRHRINSSLYLSLLGFFVEKPNYGYDLYKTISSESTFFTIWYLKQSQFYGFLDRLLNEGFLSYKMIEGAQYPDRKLLSITSQGQKQLDEWLITPVKRGRDMRQEFIAKLFILEKVNNEKIEVLIENQLLTCHDWMEEQEQILSEEIVTFQVLLTNYRKLQIQAMIDWLIYVKTNVSKIKY